MMPNPIQGGAPPGMGGGGGVPVGPGPAASGDQPSPDTMRQQLVMLLKKAKEMAEKNGVNFSDVIAEVEGNKSRSDVPLPRPPKAEMP